MGKTAEVGSGKGSGDYQSHLITLCARLRNTISADQWQNVVGGNWKRLKLENDERWRIDLQILLFSPRDCKLCFAMAGERVLTPNSLRGVVD